MPINGRESDLTSLSRRLSIKKLSGLPESFFILQPEQRP